MYFSFFKKLVDARYIDINTFSLALCPQESTCLTIILKRVHKIYNTCGTKVIVNYTGDLMFPTEGNGDT